MSPFSLGEALPAVPSVRPDVSQLCMPQKAWNRQGKRSGARHLVGVQRKERRMLEAQGVHVTCESEEIVDDRLVSAKCLRDPSRLGSPLPIASREKGRGNPSMRYGTILS